MHSIDQFQDTLFALKTLVPVIKRLNLNIDLSALDPNIVKHFLDVPNPQQFLNKLQEVQKEI